MDRADPGPSSRSAEMARSMGEGTRNQQEGSLVVLETPSWSAISRERGPGCGTARQHFRVSIVVTHSWVGCGGNGGKTTVGGLRGVRNGNTVNS